MKNHNNMNCQLKKKKIITCKVSMLKNWSIEIQEITKNINTWMLHATCSGWKRNFTAPLVP